MEHEVIRLSSVSFHHLHLGIMWSTSSCTNGGFHQQYLHINQSLSKIENLFFGATDIILKLNTKNTHRMPRFRVRPHSLGIVSGVTGLVVMLVSLRVLCSEIPDNGVTWHEYYIQYELKIKKISKITRSVRYCFRRASECHQTSCSFVDHRTSSFGVYMLGLLWFRRSWDGACRCIRSYGWV